MGTSRSETADVRRRRSGTLQVTCWFSSPLPEGALLNTAHTAVHLETRRLTKKKKKSQTPLTTPRKRSFDGRCQRRRREILPRPQFGGGERVHQSANDKTTTWPPSCRLSLKKLLRSTSLVALYWPRSERGHQRG